MATTKTKKQTESLPEKDMQRFLKKAVRRIFLQDLWGRDKPFRFGMSDLHDDGRTAKKYARILCEQGLLAPTKGSAKGRAITFEVDRDAVLDSFEPEKPDLVAMLKSSEYALNDAKRGGGRLETYGQAIATDVFNGGDAFTDENIAYIIVHHDEYEFGYYAYSKYTEHEWGSDPGNDRPYNGTIVVSDKPYDDFVYELRLGERIVALYNQNISWALQELCGVSEDDASFMADDGSVIPHIPRSFDRKLEASDWSEIHKNGLTNSENALAFHTRKLEALHRIQLAVAKYGGWEKFQADYRKRIEDHLRKQDEEGDDE